VLLRSALNVRNDDPTKALVVRVWHRSNAFMSDGDAPWLDADGAQTGERSHDRFLAPGETLDFPVLEELGLTLLAGGQGEARGIVDSVRGYFRSGSTDSGGADAQFSLTNTGSARLRVRVFASATLQISPLREISLEPGEAAGLSTGAEGISVRVG
jgi:hypothetical protein